MAMDYLKKAKIENKLAVGSCPHGFMFQRLYYLRGFTNLMKDFVLQPPELNKLVDVVLDYNMKLIRRWLEVGVDLLSCGDDVGMQDRLVINPRMFRKYLVPAYSTMFGAARERGVHVFLHSDGHILEVAEDLVKAGVTILNPQDLVNGVENIKNKLKGRVCIDIDVDRQKVVPFGKPAAIKRHVRNVISALNSPEGGLMVTAGIYPPTPLENIEALCEALEEAGAGPRS
jgi:uroporphyrinogen-III decarboxylase